MKVYQLMSLLESFPAGAEVVVGLATTLNAEIESIEKCDNGTAKGQVIITGGDAEMIDEDGESRGYLTEIASKQRKR